ncbi:uncharacterized protein LOC133200647 [Saccostrea echinata]|uniref:uncharacterized protein LOC133200647 n=1 Tax=Saccostrea echinata TaxID=191078 RepID=UPI002A808689|nr:uncharacterized protein LOC133200647 [Saccostrea echinata]
MCHEVGTSQLVAMRRDAMDIWDTTINQQRTNNEDSSMVSGSRREGFRMKGSDIDLMCWPNDRRVIWELSQSQYYNTRRQKLILCDCSESPPGFTLLYLPSTNMHTEMRTVCFRMYNRHYISSSKYRQMSCRLRPYISTPHGPCASGNWGSLEWDNAFCFVSDFWPPSASSWIDRCHSWPKPHIVDDIVENGCHFVAIGHKLGRHEDHEWRISFSLAEQKLVYAMNHCQFLIYGLLKLFLKGIINNGLGDDDKLLCSYHMKTAVFWVIQQNTILHWCPQNLLEGFWVCFKLILKWVYEGICPNFFIPDNNMFLSKIHCNKQHQLFITLYGLYEKGIAFLLHSPFMRSYIVNVLHYPRLSICTDEHTLISEASFDENLYIETQSHYVFIELNIQRYIWCLHTIEQIIGSPLLTQYQVLRLQRLTAFLLQEIAFILHMENYTHENKLRYRAEKMSFHMLKLAVKFGCISDMMYIAMYYYKTLRYIEALSILEKIKVKLAQPYLMYRLNADKDMYTEAVGGQSWSKKMKQAVAMDILLDNKIHFISELIPEQQSSLQNGCFISIVPLFILLHMLEILCCRHVDTMRAQTVLDDLQTLVHYDEGQLLDPILRDIIWQILGICQQVTGNLQAALYSYQQSLSQEPCIKIRTATQMRIHEISLWNQ